MLAHPSRTSKVPSSVSVSAAARPSQAETAAVVTRTCAPGTGSVRPPPAHTRRARPPRRRTAGRAVPPGRGERRTGTMTGMTTLHTNPLFARLAGGTGDPGGGPHRRGGAGPAGRPPRLVVSPGFGLDAYHGVNHVQVLENIAVLERAGAYLGAFSVHAPPVRARSASTRRPTPRSTRRSVPASSTAPSRRPSGASSATSGSPDAPEAASCSSTRCCPCTSPSTCRASPPAVGTWTGSRTPV